MVNSRNTNIVFGFAFLSLMISDNYAEVPLWPYLVLMGVYFSVQAYGSIKLSAQFFVPVFSSGDQKSKLVSLTFDDGPIIGKTEAILDILDQYNVKASFFCIGNRVKENPAIMKRIHSSGHLIANHSYWHGKMFDLQAPGAISKELADTDQIILETVGVKPQFFRPPYGVTNPMVAAAIAQGKYKTIGWSIRSLDTVIKDADKLFDKVVASLKGGDIILFHDFGEATLNVLPRVIDHIEKNGLRIVRVDELLNEKAYA